MTPICEAIGCNCKLRPGMFLCSTHWRAVPADTQKTINTRYRLLRKDYAFLSDVAYLSACVSAIDGIAATEGKEGINPYSRHLLIAERRATKSTGLATSSGMCAKCGLPILPGQAYNGATKNHWDCDPFRSPKALADDMDKAITKAKDALARMTKGKRA